MCRPGRRPRRDTEKSGDDLRGFVKDGLDVVPLIARVVANARATAARRLAASALDRELAKGTACPSDRGGMLAEGRRRAARVCSAVRFYPCLRPG
jgi:hypothetical protein